MDGSVNIGVNLDTSSVLSAVASLESRLALFGEKISDALSSPIISAELASALSVKLEEMLTAVHSYSSEIRSAMTSSAQSAISAFSSAPWANTGSSAVSSVANGMNYSSSDVTAAAKRIAESSTSAFRSQSWSNIGRSMMDGISDGIISAGGEVVRAIERVSREAERAVKAYYKINSPSALMRDEVGVMISRGIAEGITGGSSYVSSAMERVYSPQKLSHDTVQNGSVTQNIYLRENENSPYLTAKRIRKESEAVFRNS